jgi:hypothetical protein
VEVLYTNGRIEARDGIPSPGDPALYYRTAGETDWRVIPLRGRDEEA